MMKNVVTRIAKVMAWVTGAVLLVAVGAIVYVSVRGIPRYPAHPPELTVERTPEQVAHGKKLAGLMCAACHEDSTTHRYTGKRLADLPSVFGELFSSNITQHASKGIGSWTDGELAYLLRTGIRRDGQYLPPWMIKVPHLSDDDLAALIAFLRSEAPEVAASDVAPPGTTKPSLLSKFLTNTVVKPLPYPASPIVTPPRSDRVAFGRYLTYNLDCYSCHSADFKKIDTLAPEKTPGFLAGGNTLIGVEGRKVLSANLTPDEETGIGRWSEAEFVRALRQGFRPDGRVLRYPMLPKPELDADEAAAIYAYLRTVPRIRNVVRQPEIQAGEGASQGKRLYAQYGCTGCHGEGGSGSDGVPHLRLVNEHFTSDAALRAWIEDASVSKPDTKMPVWRNVIAKDDYAPLIAYVRSLGPAPSPQAALARQSEAH